MTSHRQAEILRKRKAQYIAWLNISPGGHALTMDEARELEQAGFGEVHGGENGIFWLYPSCTLSTEKKVERPRLLYQNRHRRSRRESC